MSASFADCEGTFAGGGISVSSDFCTLRADMSSATSLIFGSASRAMLGVREGIRLLYVLRFKSCERACSCCVRAARMNVSHAVRSPHHTCLSVPYMRACVCVRACVRMCVVHAFCVSVRCLCLHTCIYGRTAIEHAMKGDTTTRFMHAQACACIDTKCTCARSACVFVRVPWAWQR